MELDEKRIEAITFIVGRATIELMMSGCDVTPQSIVARLEFFMSNTEDATKRKIMLEAAEIIRVCMAAHIE